MNSKSRKFGIELWNGENRHAIKKRKRESFRQNNQAKKVESETDASHRNVHNSKSLQI